MYVVQALEEKLQNIVPTHRVGPVLFCTDPLKLALVLEAQHWKEAYGKSVLAGCGCLSSIHIKLMIDINRF